MAILDRPIDSSEAGDLLAHPRSIPAKLLTCRFVELREDRLSLLLDHLGDLFLENRWINLRVWSEPPKRLTDYQFVCAIKFHRAFLPRSLRQNIALFSVE